MKQIFELDEREALLTFERVLKRGTDESQITNPDNVPLENWIYGAYIYEPIENGNYREPQKFMRIFLPFHAIEKLFEQVRLLKEQRVPDGKPTDVIDDLPF